ncbi:MAG: ATP-binding cassette domain-containing protein, partial [Synergistaceae bacterium]
MITVKNLTKKFGNNTVLNDISFTISKGEKIVIVGPSGSGKSTFLRCLNLLEDPTAGEVWFKDILINSPKSDVDKHRQKMGMVFQHFNLFSHMTIMKNLTYAPVKLKIQTEAEAAKSANELLVR